MDSMPSRAQEGKGTKLLSLFVLALLGGPDSVPIGCLPSYGAGHLKSALMGNSFAYIIHINSGAWQK